MMKKFEEGALVNYSIGTDQSGWRLDGSGDAMHGPFKTRPKPKRISASQC